MRGRRFKDATSNRTVTNETCLGSDLNNAKKVTTVRLLNSTISNMSENQSQQRFKASESVSKHVVFNVHGQK